MCVLCFNSSTFQHPCRSFSICIRMRKICLEWEGFGYEVTWGRHHETRPCYRLQVQVRRKEENDSWIIKGSKERRQPAREWRWKPQKRWIPATAPDAKVATKEERSMLQELALPLLFFLFFFEKRETNSTLLLLLERWDLKIQGKYTTTRLVWNNSSNCDGCESDRHSINGLNNLRKILSDFYFFSLITLRYDIDYKSKQRNNCSPIYEWAWIVSRHLFFPSRKWEEKQSFFVFLMDFFGLSK